MTGSRPEPGLTLARPTRQSLRADANTDPAVVLAAGMAGQLAAREEIITVDVEAELAKLSPAGWRPLRPAAPDPALLP